MKQLRASASDHLFETMAQSRPAALLREGKRHDIKRLHTSLNHVGDAGGRLSCFA
jgi:hypothetical protein